MCIRAININKKMSREQNKMQKYIWCAIYIKFEHKKNNTMFIDKCALTSSLKKLAKE